MFAGPPDFPDRYCLREAVSDGSEGVFWRGTVAVDTHELPVGIKVIHERNVGQLDLWRERWSRQAELLRSLDHPGLVRVREVFDGAAPHPPGSPQPADRRLYLVMN